MTTFNFRRRTTNIPDPLLQAKSFDADDLLGALQQASDYWWSGETVLDYQISGQVITLLSPSPSGNVIGTLYWSNP